jgi:SinI restriction endonuclease
MQHMRMTCPKKQKSGDNMQGWEDTARSAMDKIAPQHTDQFVVLIDFLQANPRVGKSIESLDMLPKLAESYAKSRIPKSPQPPKTVSDETVSYILNVYFGIDEKDLERAKEEHKLSMAAENMVGDLLERYLAGVLEPKDWVWCAGLFVTAVDFIKPVNRERNEWYLLQVKNRKSTENSSGKKVRRGTDIKHWFRTFPKTGKTNWDAFPDEELRVELSEEGFQVFVRGYFDRLKAD